MPQKKRKNTNKIDMKAKAPNEQLTIVLVNEYKGFNYMVQQIGKLEGDKRMFQYIIFDPDTRQFFQTFFTIKPEVDEFITLADIARTTVSMNGMVKATIEELIRKKNPNYQGTDEEEAERLAGQEIIKILEKNEK